MSVTVRLYAGVKEAAGVASLELEVKGAGGTTVASLRDAVAEACPAIANRLGHCRFAVNDEFADDDAAVADGAAVDVIPPVSGG